MITGIDHIVLTVSDIDASVAFYSRVLKMTPIRFGEGRQALGFGNQKINLQTLGQEPRNHAAVGSGDVCLLTDAPLSDVEAHLRAEGVTTLEGPVQKSGARGAITSLYFTDPDGNLIEVSRYN